MQRVRILFGLLAAVAFSGLLFGDDPKKPGDDKKDPVIKTNHQLSPNYGKLGLSDDQKKRIYAVQDEYGPKIAKLKKELEDMQKDEKGKVYNVLSDDQKKHLKEIRDSKDGGADKKDDKKP